MVQLLKQRYLPLKKLGQGGMGAVYKAKDTNLGDRLVAVKEMIQHNLDSQQIIKASKAFKQEADMLASLHHPNLPSIHEHFEEAGRWYLVMEFIEGETLEDYLKVQGGRLPFKEVLNIGIQLCTALNYLHTRQPPIIFRDLKPLNIMHATAQSDIYSLGATLHYLLSGSHPALSPFRFAPLPQGQPGLARFNALIMQMVAIDENSRPKSMAVVKQELQRFDLEESQSDKLTYVSPRPTYQSLPVSPVKVATPPQAGMLPASSSYPIRTRSIDKASDMKANIWRVRNRQIVAMLLGSALYGGLSFLSKLLQLPSSVNFSIRPAVVIPLFFGAVFGPIVGLITGSLGNFLGDLISGYGVYLNWDIGSGLIGFFAGLAGLSSFNTFGRYSNLRAITIAEILGAVGVVVGIAFAAYSDIWVSNLTPASATTGEFIPAVLTDLVNGLILLPILLIVYNVAVASRGRS